MLNVSTTRSSQSPGEITVLCSAEPGGSLANVNSRPGKISTATGTLVCKSSFVPKSNPPPVVVVVAVGRAYRGYLYVN